jgi:hypothetical protein
LGSLGNWGVMMASSGDNLVLEQLRLIREELGGLRGDLASFKSETKENFDTLHSDLLGQQTIMFGLASVIGQIDKRVEHLEQKIGA